MASGGAQAELVEGLMQGCSRPRISSSRHVVLLRRCTRGQVGWRINGGEESGRRTDLLAAASDTIPAAAGAEVEQDRPG